LGTVILIGWLNPWSFIPAAIAAGGMLFIRSRFAKCSRDLRRLESVTRSPIYSYVASTIQGVIVIRSYHAEHLCSAEFLSHLDDNTRVNYLLLTVTRWAAMRFDCITLAFITLVILLVMILHITLHNFSTVDISLILSYSLSLVSLLQWTIRCVICFP
jgi:hypothetical protein